MGVAARQPARLVIDLESIALPTVGRLLKYFSCIEDEQIKESLIKLVRELANPAQE